MNYKLILIVTTLFMLIGCGNKVPYLNENKNSVDNKNSEYINGKDNISDTNSIMDDTITIDENEYNQNREDMTDSTDNEDVKNYNSSVNGFKSIYFNFGDYTISSIMQDNMSNNVEMSSSNRNKIKIEGNCDEFGTDEYNYALGLKRAKAVKTSLVLQGIESDKIVIMSYGESSPVCSDFSESCYDRNRRVDLRLVN